MISRIISRFRAAGQSDVGKEGNSALSRGVASVALRVTGATLSFTVIIFLARILGADGLGVYSYSIAIATLGAMLAQAGLPVLVVRETAKYLRQDEWRRLRGMLLGSAGMVIGISALCFIGAMLFILVARDRVPAVNVTTLIPALVLIPMIALNNVGGASLRGLGYAIKGQIAEQVLRPGLFLACLAVIWVFMSAGAVSPAVAMTSHAAAAVAAFLIGASLLLKALPAPLRREKSDFTDWGRLRKSLLPLSILTGLQVINGQTDILMLGFFYDASDVGIYRVAHQSASLITLTLFAIGLTVEPTIARLHVAGEIAKLQHIVTVTARLAFGLSLTITLLLVVFGQALLSTVFGEAFSASFVPLCILSVGQVALAYAGWAVLVLNMSGNERVTAKMTAFAAAANIAANAILIPPFGVVGAAVATSSTLFVWKLSLSFVAERRTDIRSLVFPSKPSRGKT